MDSEKNPRRRERFGRDEYLELEFFEKWLERSRLVETVKMKEIGASVRSSRSRSPKSGKKKAGRGYCQVDNLVLWRAIRRVRSKSYKQANSECYNTSKSTIAAVMDRR
ncbi:hypothetical protein E2542_SST03079 [Spatholobus suberectus]|nr:hypothetical protein E2542_SST03079 [Spatholobus suberectus]